MISFSGRINRAEFAKFFVAIFVAAIIFASIITWLGSNGMDSVVTIMGIIWAIVGATLSFSFAVRRFHDMGHTGWYSLGLVVPILNFIVLLVLFFKASQPQENAYGTVK